MTLTKDDIDLAEQEFVLCWRDQTYVRDDCVVAPVAIGYEYRWKEICEAARNWVVQQEKDEAFRVTFVEAFPPDALEGAGK